MIITEVQLRDDGHGQKYLELEVEPIGRVYVKADQRDWTEIVEEAEGRALIDNLQPEDL